MRRPFNREKILHVSIYRRGITVRLATKVTFMLAKTSLSYRFIGKRTYMLAKTSITVRLTVIETSK